MSFADDFCEIQNLKARYCAAADRAPEDREDALRQLRGVFAADVTCDYGFDRPIEGGEALAAFLSDVIAGNSEWIIHNAHSPLIEIDGGRATGRWTVIARMKRCGSGEIDTVVGRYADRFLREDGTWKIGHIAFQRYE